MIIDGMRSIAPSQTSPWEGTAVEGEDFTREQLDVLKRERPNWKTFQRRPVTLSAPAFNRWDTPEQTVVQCPIIAWTKDRKRVLIVAPAGDKKWLSAK